MRGQTWSDPGISLTKGRSRRLGGHSEDPNHAGLLATPPVVSPVGQQDFAVRARRPRDHNDYDDEKQGQGQPHASPLGHSGTQWPAQEPPSNDPNASRKPQRIASGGVARATVAKTVTGKLKLRKGIANRGEERKNI